MAHRLFWSESHLQANCDMAALLFSWKGIEQRVQEVRAREAESVAALPLPAEWAGGLLHSWRGLRYPHDAIPPPQRLQEDATLRLSQSHQRICGGRRTE